MARIRTIKPEFWTDDAVGECSVSARLLFIACWNFSDDHGGLDRSAKQLKAQAFPYDVIDCEALVQELLDAGLLIEYTVSGKDYLHIKNFRKHQRVEKPGNPRIPIYDESMSVQRGVAEDSPSPHGGVTVSSLEGNGREKEGRVRTSSHVRAPTATRLPEAFELTLDRQAVAKAEGIADPAREFAKFTDYWRAASGANARKHDWDATWRNWCRRASEAKPVNGRKPYTPGPTVAELEIEEAAKLGITVEQYREREYAGH